MEITLAAPAKINLHLGVWPGRDARGYHRAESLMVAVGLHDTVRVQVPGGGPAARPGAEPRVAYDPPLDVDARDTAVWRAVRGLAEALGRPAAARVRVERGIPSESGLGSASTDAAAALLALARLWGVGAPAADPRVVAVARAVGADVAFFLHPVPSLLVGVGDELAETYPSPPAIPVALVRPPAGVSTPAAFAEFDQLAARVVGEPPSPRALAAALAAGDVAGVATHLHNSLAVSAERLVPEVAEVRSWLAARPGTLAAQVTGSGSCVFALCASPAAAKASARAAAARGWWSCATQTTCPPATAGAAAPS